MRCEGTCHEPTGCHHALRGNPFLSAHAGHARYVRSIDVGYYRFQCCVTDRPMWCASVLRRMMRSLNYLVRAYSSVEDRQRRQDEFYGSAEWRDGPRQAILDLIEDRRVIHWVARPTSVVIPMDDHTIDRLRNK